MATILQFPKMSYSIAFTIDALRLNYKNSKVQSDFQSRKLCDYYVLDPNQQIGSLCFYQKIHGFAQMHDANNIQKTGENDRRRSATGKDGLLQTEAVVEQQPVNLKPSSKFR